MIIPDLDATVGFGGPRMDLATTAFFMDAVPGHGYRIFFFLVVRGKRNVKRLSHSTPHGMFPGVGWEIETDKPTHHSSWDVPRRWEGDVKRYPLTSSWDVPRRRVGNTIFLPSLEALCESVQSRRLSSTLDLARFQIELSHEVSRNKFSLEFVVRNCRRISRG